MSLLDLTLSDIPTVDLATLQKEAQATPDFAFPEGTPDEATLRNAAKLYIETKLGIGPLPAAPTPAPENPPVPPSPPTPEPLAPATDPTPPVPAPAPTKVPVTPEDSVKAEGYNFLSIQDNDQPLLALNAAGFQNKKECADYLESIRRDREALKREHAALDERKVEMDKEASILEGRKASYEAEFQKNTDLYKKCQQLIDRIRESGYTGPI